MTGRKFGLSLILNIIIKVLAVALGILTARWANNNLTELEYCEYNTIIAYTAIIMTVLVFGLPTIIQKYYTNVYEPPKRYQLWSAFMVFRIASYFLGLLAIFFTFNLSGSQNLALVVGFFSVQFILLIDSHYRAICDAEGRSWQFSITDFVAKVLVVVILYAGLSIPELHINTWFVLLCLFVGYSVSLFIDAVWQHKDAKFIKPDFTTITSNLKPIVWLTLASVVFAAYNSTDKLFIANSGLPPSDLNSYTNGYKVFENVLIIPGITIPMIASYMKRRFDAKQMGSIAEFIAKKSKILSFNIVFFTEWIAISLFIGLCLALGILLAGPILLWLIDPNSLYPKALEILPFLALAIFIEPSIVTIAQFIIFNPSGEKYELISHIIVMIIALTGYTVLIPKLGIVGAALTTAIYLFVDFFVKIYFLQKVLKKEAPAVN